MLIICAMALSAFGIGIASFAKIFPLSPEVPMAIYRPLEVEDFISLKHMGEKRSSNVNQSFAKFFLGEYVKSREEYQEKKLDRNFNFVATLSSPEVFDNFSAETSLENPNNPKLVYGNKAEIYIDIYRTTLVNEANIKAPEDSNDLSKAIVIYSAIVVFDDGTQQVTNHQADISFQYKQIIVDQKDNSITQKPELVVTSYKTKSL
jgi:type IV secretory pathway component VirB8